MSYQTLFCGHHGNTDILWSSLNTLGQPQIISFLYEPITEYYSNSYGHVIIQVTSLFMWPLYEGHLTIGHRTVQVTSLFRSPWLSLE